MFDNSKEYAFFKNIFTQREFRDELGREGKEPVPLPVLVGRGKVANMHELGIQLDGGVILNAYGWDFATPINVQENKEKKA